MKVYDVLKADNVGKYYKVKINNEVLIVTLSSDMTLDILESTDSTDVDYIIDNAYTLNAIINANFEGVEI